MNSLPSSVTPITIRKASLEDLEGITVIYNESVLYSTATADTDIKTVADRLAWFHQHGELYPIWVALSHNALVGWASLSAWSDRVGYKQTAENSVYIRRDFQRRGVGKTLMATLMAHTVSNPIHTLIAKISDDNFASIRLHESFGFQTMGVLKQTIWKFEKWVDVRLMQWIKEPSC